MLAKFRNTLFSFWQPLVSASAIVTLLVILLSYRLGSLVPGLSGSEIAELHLSQSLHDIIRNPVNGPYKICLYLASKIGLANLINIRFVSVIFGTLAAVLFYMIIRKRYSLRLSLLGTILFSTSSWYLHVSRLVDVSVLMYAILALIYSGLLIRDYRHKKLSIFILVTVSCFILYIPGMDWFILLGLIWERKYIISIVKSTPLVFLLIICLWVTALLSPLGYSLIYDYRLVLTLIGAPGHLPGIREYFHNFLEIPINIFVRGPQNPMFWLGRLPLLDIFSSVMFILGAYTLLVEWRQEFNRVILSYILLALVLVAFNGPVNITILLPFVYFIVIAGLWFLLQQWLSVFPRNPIARALGICLIVIAIGTASYYHFYSYFIAWPHNPATVSTFLKKS